MTVGAVTVAGVDRNRLSRMIENMQQPTTSAPMVRDPDETIEIRKLIEEVVPDWKAWQITPNPVLGGERPVDLINTPKEAILRDMLRGAKHGMMS